MADEQEPTVDLEDIGPSDTTKPFDPALIRIEHRVMSVDQLVRRLAQNEIDLLPDFQRAGGLWKPREKSRLIESLMIRIPIPAFYMDASDESRWVVVDGLQRLTVLNEYIVEKSWGLEDLEFQPYGGKKFDDLPRGMQRRIEEAQVTVYLIQPGTPPEVKYNIFKRINTGGLPLSPQEIRHALNQGQSTELLKKLAETESFIKATDNGLRNQRMQDRECVLRFLSFLITPYREYKTQDLDGFLNRQMAVINRMSPIEVKRLEGSFHRAMSMAVAIFGNDAFRKRYSRQAPRKPINKALFETWSVNLARLGPDEALRLEERRDALIDGFIALMHQWDFDRAVTQGTGDVAKLHLRFSGIEQLIQKVVA